MPSTSFDYAVVRVVPRVDRGERINAGVILHCRERRFLAARIAFDRARAAALDPALDLDEVERALAIIPRVAAGDPDAGPVARLDQAERFHWLVAPRSTIVQPSSVHSGICEDPDAALQRLMSTMVLTPSTIP